MATLLIVALVTAALATGVSFASVQMAKSVEISQSKVLYSSLANIVQSELRNTWNEATFGNVVDGSYPLKSFLSPTYGNRETPTSRFVKVSEEGSLTDGYGQIAVTDTNEVESLDNRNLVLSKGAYGDGMGASVVIYGVPNSAVGGDDTVKYFHVILQVADSAGDILTEGAFDVEPLNEVGFALG